MIERREAAVEAPREAALAACERARAKNRRRYFSADHWQCWGCMRFGGEPEKRCMHTDDGGWSGCPIANRELGAESDAKPAAT
jgi:hypothetical protein